jgi:hypothetical protein
MLILHPFRSNLLHRAKFESFMQGSDLGGQTDCALPTVTQQANAAATKRKVGTAFMLATSPFKQHALECEAANVTTH